MGSNPVEALSFFRLLSSRLNWKIHCEDHSSLPSITQFKYMNYFIYTYIISLLTGRYELNKLTSLPMCGFIAQLVEQQFLHPYNTRYAANQNFFKPSVCTNGVSTFKFFAVKIWESVPSELKCFPYLVFKKQYKKFLLTTQN